MKFNQESLQNKIRYLDLTATQQDLVRKVVGRNISGSFNLKKLDRVWEPGGGATMFQIESAQRRYLLKVKHCEVWVESRLESEPQFLHISSLRNEHKFFQLLNKAGVNWIPRISFFDSMDSLEFLAVEWLETFNRVTPNLTAVELLESWDQLQRAVQQLFEQGIVHTDIHEYNLCFRGKQIVLIDFEEARFLKQDLPFKQSLDVIGENCYGNVGDFPVIDGYVLGRTCLIRLKQVFKNMIRQRLDELIKQCYFDYNCPYNLDVLQQSDYRVYQSLNFDNLKIAGQRPLDDSRLDLMMFLLKRFPRIHSINHLDIGSNLGMFCFTLSKLKFIKHSVGVEASKEYVNLSKLLAFIYDQEKTDFHQLICGESPLADFFPDMDVITMFSVYHHIVKKDFFLDDLRRLNVQCLIAEFATQDRFYPERGSLQAEIRYVQERLGFPLVHTLMISKDYNRPIVLFSNTPLDLLTKFGSTWISKGGWQWVWEHVRHPVTTSRSVLGRLPAFHRVLARLKHSWHANTQNINNLAGRHSIAHAQQWISAQSVPSAGIRIYANGKYSYPEVTGYYISSLLDWGERDRAIQYAQWLVSIQNADGSWSDPSGKTPYTFDTGQILKGLIAILPVLPYMEEPIRRGCEWLLTQIEPNGRVTTPDKSDWHQPGGNLVSENIHLYALEPLRNAGELFEEPRFTRAVKSALDYYLAQPELTRFNSLSHFHAYVLEALVDLGYPDVAARGMAEVERLQRKNGSVPAYPDMNWVCSTGLAQYAVIWYKLGHREPAEKALDYLFKIQNSSGGFYGSYGRGANYFPNKEISWAVKFFLDAYQWHVRTAFDAEVALFPDTIEESDGRFQAVLKGLGNLAGLRVLDAGCGKGRFARALHARYPSAEVWGVDVSDTMLRSAPPDVKTRQGSLLNLPFADGYFDCVYCVEALEHAIRPEAAINELSRVLRPRGRFVIVDKNLEHLGTLKIETWEQWFQRVEVEGWLSRYCTSVHSEFIAYGGKAEPDGLFIAWQGIRQY